MPWAGGDGLRRPGVAHDPTCRHDWDAELPFDAKGGRASHRGKAIGKNFPQNSVGWYRKAFTVPNADLGQAGSTLNSTGCSVIRRSGSTGFIWARNPAVHELRVRYLRYLNYAATMSWAVRVDASLEETWSYEGAGIYRHVWLPRPRRSARGAVGTFVTTEVGAIPRRLRPRGPSPTTRRGRGLLHRAEHSRRRGQGCRDGRRSRI